MAIPFTSPSAACQGLQARVSSALPSLPSAYGAALAAAAAECAIPFPRDGAHDGTLTFFVPPVPTLSISQYIAQIPPNQIGNIGSKPQGATDVSLSTLGGGSANLWTDDDGVWVSMDAVYVVSGVVEGEGWIVYSLAEPEDEGEGVEKDGDKEDDHDEDDGSDDDHKDALELQTRADPELMEPNVDSAVLKGGGGGRGGGGGGGGKSSSSSTKSSSGSSVGSVSSKGSVGGSSSGGSSPNANRVNPVPVVPIVPVVPYYGGVHGGTGTNHSNNNDNDNNKNTNNNKKKNAAARTAPLWTLPIAVLAAMVM